MGVPANCSSSAMHAERSDSSRLKPDSSLTAFQTSRRRDGSRSMPLDTQHGSTSARTLSRKASSAGVGCQRLWCLSSMMQPVPARPAVYKRTNAPRMPTSADATAGYAAGVTGSTSALNLKFRGGTLELRGLDREASPPAGCIWDARTACFRAPASAYAAVRRALARAGHEVEDGARGYEELADGARVRREPRPYQAEALAAWQEQQHRGVVVLPTGAGKTWVACLAIDDRRRSTLVVAPTLDLVRQWYDVLRTTFGIPVGIVGGGDYEIRKLTVSTYDSAYLHMEHLGNKFGLVVFDECHHLPGAAYALAARASVAPFRLGLTATPERADGRHARSRRADRSGRLPKRHRRPVRRGLGDYLAPYETVRLVVELGPEERRAHDEARAVYRDFVVRQGIRMSSPSGWSTSSSGRAQRRRPAGDDRLPPPAGDRLRGARQAGLRRPADRPPPRRPDAAVHPRQRDGLRARTPLSDPDHHPRNQGPGAERDPRRAWPRDVTAQWSRPGSSTKASTSRRPASRSWSRAAPPCGNTCSGWGGLRAREGKHAMLYELVTARNDRNVHQRAAA